MMRLTVVVPDDAHRRSAGVRIRYGRLAAPLAAKGVSLAVETIDQVVFGAAEGAHAFLFSKCLDARALAAAHGLRRAGVPVGLDVFDDYISQDDDSRLVPSRTWTRAMLPLATFAVCSTAAIRTALHAHRPDLPAVLVADPAPERTDPAPEPTDPAPAASGRPASAIGEGAIDLCWFGIGDNPFFPVGVHDLAAFGPVLAGFRARGLEPTLTVLTNRRALTGPALAALVRLPFAIRLEDWSEDRQARVLSRVDAVFLPVNGQPFSRAKSLNRALTALAAGAQVLTTGHPLYADLSDLLYTDVGRLAADLRAGTLRNTAERRARVLGSLAHLADPDTIAADLARFLASLPPADAAGDLPDLVGVVHGHGSTGQVHKFVRKLGYLSIGGPFAHLPLAFDVTWPAPGADPDLRLSERARAAARADFRARLMPVEGDGGKRLYRIALADVLGDAAADLPSAVGPEQSVRLAAYGRGQGAVADAVRRLFGPIALYAAETTAPAWIGPGGLDGPGAAP